MSRRSEVEHRVRVAVIEQAVGMGLPRFAETADRSSDPGEILETAVAETTRLLGLAEDDQDAVRLAITVGVMVGQLVAVLRRGGTRGAATGSE